MANDGIGITFMPSGDPNAPNAQGGETGPGGSDLSDAFKILSLHLPQTVGPRSLASERLLTARGSAGANGFNPHAAVFAALLRSLLGSGAAPNLSSGAFQVGMPGGSRSGNQTSLPPSPPDPLLTVPTLGIVPGVPVPPPSPRTGAGDLSRPSTPDTGGPNDLTNPRMDPSYY